MSLLTRFDAAARGRWTPQAITIIDTMHPALREVLLEVGRTMDVLVIAGYRSREEQDALKRDGQSLHGWPNSLHNRLPALAMDIAPYPAGEDSPERMAYLAGCVLQQARAFGFRLAWAADADADHIFNAESFSPPVWRHFRLVESWRL